MSSVASQFGSGASQAMDLLGVPAVYTRSNGVTCSLTVSLARPQSQVDLLSGQTMMIAAESWEIVFAAASLVFDGAVYEPRNGDVVVVSDGPQAGRYVAAIPDAQQDCWNWADRFRVRRRLFTKLTAN